MFAEDYAFNMSSTNYSLQVAVDMKKKLLLAMKGLLDQGMKIESLRAWGWFIRLLGTYAMKNKHLINEMLKNLEQTFSEFDPQVQIASLVAWEGLIDATVDPGVQLFGLSESTTTCNEAGKNLKRIKLIMAPLVGIISSKCDVSVHISCISTWSYLLHKLGSCVSCPLVISMVWQPIIKAVFQVGFDNKNIWLWNFCLDLFNNLILERNQGAVRKLLHQEINQLSFENTIDGNLASRKHTLKSHEISYSSWNLRQLDFFLSMISLLVKKSNTSVAPEFRKLANEAALRLFGSLMETVQRTLQHDNITYDDIMQCLNAIFGFLGSTCENMASEDHTYYYNLHISLEFLKVATEALSTSILGSPLYKVGFEIKNIKTVEYAAEIRCPTVSDTDCVENFDGRVLPVVHLCALYFSVVLKSSSRIHEYESQLQQMQGYLKFVLSSYNPQDVLHAFLCSLYENTVPDSIQMWIVMVNCLQECFSAINDQSILLMEASNAYYHLVLRLLLYPFASWPLCQTKLELQIVAEAWNLLYVSVDQVLQSVHCPVKSFPEDLCASLNRCIDQFLTTADTLAELQLTKKMYYGRFALLCGNAIICILKQLPRRISSNGMPYIDFSGQKSRITNSLELAARFMKLFWENKEITEGSHLSMASRFLSASVNFVECLHQKEDVLMLVESTSTPLLSWLSEMQLLDENANHQLHLLWDQMLKALQRSEPSPNFDSSFLGLLQPLLEATLDHPNPSISEMTVKFWNSTFGSTHHKLDFSEKLLPLLDKLYRNGKIKICNRNHSTADTLISSRYNITSLRKCSKRVEIIDNPLSRHNKSSKVSLSAKRKCPELTEHQKEVRRAQQGRTRDCNGRGPGIRTYTSADFSQDNEESQDSPHYVRIC
ncbi:uncharacterized protein LOC127263359 isoform X2 [Andrographis paniculata]|uniref:uncharacterized protein LOC127263359 isoform X2 n=1 Tax=Andrographis paniculata TaxID=175694 RepID=UPI0021E80B26|nr:uncharacterized protein LOC127263359 isoform X2 [Andrographis paniculata]